MFRNPTTDLIVVLVIVLLILGPKRLPGLGKSLGTGMREFKDSITGDSKDEDEQRPAISASAGNSEPSRALRRSSPRPRIAAPPRSVPSEASSGASAGRARGRGAELTRCRGFCDPSVMRTA